MGFGNFLTSKKKSLDALATELLFISVLVITGITYIYCFPYIEFLSGFIDSTVVSLLNIAAYIGTLFLLVACAVIAISRIVIYKEELKIPTKMMLCAIALCAGGIIPLSIGNKSISESTYLHGFRTSSTTPFKFVKCNNVSPII